MAAEKSQKREWPFAGVWGTAAGPVVKLDLVSCACGGARTCILCALARRHLRSQLRPWGTRGMIQGLQPLEAEVPLPDQSLCFQCHIGWSDDSTGPLLACKGSCNRAFHAGCRPGFDDNQHCTLCSGEDEVVCRVCRREWSDPSKQSDYYTGEMVVATAAAIALFIRAAIHRPSAMPQLLATKHSYAQTVLPTRRRSLLAIPPPPPPSQAPLVRGQSLRPQQMRQSRPHQPHVSCSAPSLSLSHEARKASWGLA